MAAPGFSLFLLLGLIAGTIGSETESSSSISSWKQKVLELEKSVTSIPQTLQEAIEQLLITVLDEMEEKLKNYASIDEVSRMGDALQKELKALQADRSQVEQSLRNHTLLIEKLGKQMEDFQNRCAGEPPSPPNGKTVEFERQHGSVVGYECDKNFIMTGDSTVRCHFGKWDGQPPLCIHTASADAHLLLRAHVDKNLFVLNVSCSSQENNEKIQFYRLLDTGTGEALPSDAKTFSKDRTAVLDLSGVAAGDRRGAYLCGYERDGRRSGISFLIDLDGFFIWPKIERAGDAVYLLYTYSNFPEWRWLHDGRRVPEGDARGGLQIGGLRREDSGIYELYLDGSRSRQQRFFKLAVRDCRADFFGEGCDQVCPTCENGGVCHDRLGTCFCRPGFEGKNCEIACGGNRFGPNCSESCDGGDCFRQIFCRPDPFGCSCAAGYRGNGCDRTDN